MGTMVFILEFLKYCSWNSEKMSCSTTFKQVATDFGFCCSFNIELSKTELEEMTYEYSPTAKSIYIDYHNQINVEKGCYNYSDYSDCPYSNGCFSFANTSNEITSGFCSKLSPEHKKVNKVVEKVNRTQLKRVEQFGLMAGFTFFFDSLRCESVTQNYFSGLRMLVHHPQEFPKVYQKGFPVTTGMETFVGVTAEIIATDEDVRDEEPQKRNCFFADEVQLKYYNSYSRPRCEIECEIFYMAEVCGCVHFFLPGNHTYCSLMESQCTGSINQMKEVIDCQTKCLPVCEEVIYHTSTTMGKFPDIPPMEMQFIAEMQNESFGIFLQDEAIVSNFYGLAHVYFSNDFAIKYSRSLRYSTIDLISSIGGSVGLCLGFSLVSLIELVYFAFIRRY